MTAHILENSDVVEQICRKMKRMSSRTEPTRYLVIWFLQSMHFLHTFYRPCKTDTSIACDCRSQAWCRGETRESYMWGISQIEKQLLWECVRRIQLFAPNSLDVLKDCDTDLTGFPSKSWSTLWQSRGLRKMLPLVCMTAVTSSPNLEWGTPTTATASTPGISCNTCKCDDLSSHCWFTIRSESNHFHCKPESQWYDLHCMMQQW